MVPDPVDYFSPGFSIVPDPVDYFSPGFSMVPVVGFAGSRLGPGFAGSRVGPGFAVGSRAGPVDNLPAGSLGGRLDTVVVNLENAVDLADSPVDSQDVRLGIQYTAAAATGRIAGIGCILAADLDSSPVDY